MYGPAASTAMADLPYDARGVLSGLYQNGYSTGYLLAAVFYRALVPTTSHSWRSLFWFAAVPPVFLMAFRYVMPETDHFLSVKAERAARPAPSQGDGSGQGSSVADATSVRVFIKEAGIAIKQNWFLLIYMVFLMAGLNSCSHGSQDFFPTFLKNQAELNPSQVTVISIVGQLGSITGGTVLGYISTFLGRRPTMLIACILGGALVPAYILPRSMVLVASAYFEQVFVGGVWGPIPIHLMELSPVALRATCVGLTYQLGNLASAGSATIQAIIGERYPLAPGPKGAKRFDYGKVIAIFMGAVWAYVFFFLLVGPEMTQQEREEEAQAVQDRNDLRRGSIVVDDALQVEAKSDA